MANCIYRLWGLTLFLTTFFLSSCGSFGEGMLAGLGGMGGYGGFGGYPSYGGGGNMNYLLDPNYAIAQTMQQQAYFNQVGSSIAAATISQVEAEEENEYQQFRKYNKKFDGSDYSKSEWRALKGQAIQEMKSGSTSSYSSTSSSSYGGSSSSSSSSSSQRRCTKTSASDIAHCGGSGVCAKCNGNKRYYDTSYGISKWVDPCVTCGGTGKCPSCGGKGYRY